METAVTRLETMFQKADSDLDCIQHMLEFEIMKNLPDEVTPEENPLALLEQLSAVKSRYKLLCEQLEQISIERKESMSCIRATLDKTMKLVQEIQQHTGIELSPLSEEEQIAAQHLTCQTFKGTALSAEEPLCSVSTLPNPNEEPQFEPLTEEKLMAVPRRVRSTVKLDDLNSFYSELFKYFVLNNNR
uniref:Protein FAM33A n=1 Tax=Sphenodon punctatus TaxID=8508 RepID=A0A8D0HFB1_SPHPU